VPGAEDKMPMAL